MNVEEIEKIIQEINLMMHSLNNIQLGNTDQAIKMLQSYADNCEQMVSPVFSELLKIVEDRLVDYQQTSQAKLLFQRDEILIKNHLYLMNKFQNVKGSLQEFKENRHNEIWWCWLQGLEHAPDIVLRCYESVKQLGRKINVITSENYREYIELPENIVNKWRAGIISNTHISDIIRLELLTTYGGMWVDATVLFTGTDNLDYLDSDLFVFKNLSSLGTTDSCLSASNWLLSVNKPSHILCDTKAMLYSYWEQYDETLHYFLFHSLFTIGCLNNKEEWLLVPAYSRTVPHVLQMELNNVYTISRWNQICRMTNIHKLTYKFQRPDTKEYLFWDYILSGGQIKN